MTTITTQSSEGRHDHFTKFIHCISLKEAHVILGLTVCSTFFAAQCVLGILFGWNASWQIVGAVGIPWALLPAIAIKTKLPEVYPGMIAIFIGQKITSIVAIYYAQNEFHDRLGVILNSIFLVTAIIGASLADRFRKIHSHPAINSVVTTSPLSSAFVEQPTQPLSM